MEKPTWRVRSSRYLVDSPHLRLRADAVELPSGLAIDEYYVRESDGFAIVVPVAADGRVILVRQYRYGADAVVLEFPAGSLDAGEEPLDCARRELLEETGYAADRFEALGNFLAEPVRSNSRAYVFLAQGARLVGEQSLDPTEQIDVELATLEELAAYIRQGTFPSGASIAAAHLAFERLRGG